MRWGFWAVSSNFGEKRLVSGNSASEVVPLQLFTALVSSKLKDSGTSEGAPEEAAASTWVLHWMPLDATEC